VNTVRKPMKNGFAALKAGFFFLWENRYKNTPS